MATQARPPPHVAIARGAQIRPTTPPAVIVPGCLAVVRDRVYRVMGFAGEGVLNLCFPPRTATVSLGRVSPDDMSAAAWAEFYEACVAARMGAALPSEADLSAAAAALCRTPGEWKAASLVYRRWRRGGWQVLLQHRSRRSFHPLGGAGELGFIGGARAAALDKSPLDTALREATEETGVVPPPPPHWLVATEARDGHHVFVVEGEADPLPGRSDEVCYDVFRNGHVWVGVRDARCSGVEVWAIVRAALARLFPTPDDTPVILFHGTDPASAAAIRRRGFKPSVGGPGYRAACAGCKAGTDVCTCLLLGGPAVYLSASEAKARSFADARAGSPGSGVLLRVAVRLGACKELAAHATDHAAAWSKEGYDSARRAAGGGHGDEVAVSDPARLTLI